ncbi:hypothetical protein CK203_103174 [Vitis vinifera]|uniref:DUF4283 domain-containing protein n=1 Tax=Vitis vinifera TaxID=29760 RepID=A0A438DN54_VITVI|nr:hypothetical protein CK203_103174 [Vitis vinifera]
MAGRGGQGWFAVDSKSLDISIEGWKLAVEMKLWRDGVKGGRRKGSPWGVGCVAGEASSLGVETRTVASPAEGGVFESVLGWVVWEGSVTSPALPSLNNCVTNLWLLKRAVKISTFGGALLLFEFEDKCEWCCQGGFGEGVRSSSAFVESRVARILVKFKGRVLPGSLQVVVGSSSFSIQLWWEVSPWFSLVMLRSSNETSELQENSGAVGGSHALTKGQERKEGDYLGGSGSSTTVEDEYCWVELCFKDGSVGSRFGYLKLGCKGWRRPKALKGHCLRPRWWAYQEQEGGKDLAAAKRDGGSFRFGVERLEPSLATMAEPTLDDDSLVVVRWEEWSVVRRGSSLESHVAIMDKALVVEANRRAGISTLPYMEPLSPGCQPLMMLLQDGCLLELSGNATKSPSGKG